MGPEWLELGGASGGHVSPYLVSTYDKVCPENSALWMSLVATLAKHILMILLVETLKVGQTYSKIVALLIEEDSF